MNKSDISGRWEIVSWEQIYDDGRVVYPMGHHLRGFIEYGPYGMFCIIAKVDRQGFTTGGQWSASDSEKAAAYSSYLTYSGGYEVEGDVIVHQVEHSLFPNWEGSSQRRIAKFQDGLLHLSARLEADTSEARHAILTWRKMA
ncbi:lipocalin-like domain-containing protein [Alcaligenaceae bacterium CGII-47]|nr:lipocalin-like domain-containing protein [Alcaligenaceae bacterium CGII-47]